MKLISRFSARLSLFQFVSAFARIKNYSSLACELIKLAEFSSKAKFVWMPNARAALKLALLNAGIKEGDFVVAPQLTCSQVHNAIKAVGGVLVPVEGDNRGIPSLQDYLAAQKKVSARFIIVVEYFSLPMDLQILREKMPRGTVLIRDSALCFSGLSFFSDGGGADYEVFSFGSGKPFSLGYGGLLKSFQGDLRENILPAQRDSFFHFLKKVFYFYISNAVRTVPLFYALFRKFFSRQQEGRGVDENSRMSTLNGGLKLAEKKFPSLLFAMLDFSCHSSAKACFKNMFFIEYCKLKIGAIDDFVFYKSNPVLVLLPKYINADDLKCFFYSKGIEASVPYELEMDDSCFRNWFLFPNFENLDFQTVLRVAKIFVSFVNFPKKDFC